MTLHLNKANLYGAMKKILQSLARGHTNLARSILNFRSFPNPRRRYADHFLKAPYTLQPPRETLDSSRDRPPARALRPPPMRRISRLSLTLAFPATLGRWRESL